MSPSMWSEGIASFTQVGFTEAEAASWLEAIEAAGGLPDRRIGYLACDYRTAGFSPDEAVVWVAHRFRPHVARAFLDAGWNPDQALALIRLYEPRWALPGAIAYYNGTPDDPGRAWLATGLPADRALRLAAAGITITELHADPSLADTDDATLAVLAALRTGGGDARH